MTLEDELDTLYGVRPEEFTALRKRLSNAARTRGERDTAKALASARRPTTAAWVVNLLVRTDPTTRPRLSELTCELRAAHAAMDGARIRELSTAQRTLVAELVRAAFTAADLPDPTAALRDDVTGTLQAAIADPEVAARLGRLEKAEQWSGFGDFGASEAVGPAAEPATPVAAAPREVDDAGRRRAAERRRAAATRQVDAAQVAHDAAVAAVADRRAAVKGARRRYEHLLETLSTAEREVAEAEAELEAADRSALTAAARLEEANAELRAASPT